MYLGHGGGAAVLRVAGEGCHFVGLEVERADHLLLAGILGAAALLLHQLLEACGVGYQAALAGHQGGQVNGEAVGVVELEGEVAAHAPFGSHFFIKQLKAAVKGLIEAGFLTQQGLLDGGGTGLQLREGGAHFCYQGVHQL